MVVLAVQVFTNHLNVSLLAHLFWRFHPKADVASRTGKMTKLDFKKIYKKLICVKIKPKQNCTSISGGRGERSWICVLDFCFTAHSYLRTINRLYSLSHVHSLHTNTKYLPFPAVLVQSNYQAYIKLACWKYGGILAVRKGKGVLDQIHLFHCKSSWIPLPRKEALHLTDTTINFRQNP